MKVTREELAKRAANLVHAAYSAGWAGGIRRMEGEVLKPKTTPSSLLDRFVEVYGEVPLRGSMIGPGVKLWRDYYEWTGEHMILTDEGWEPGEVKQSYVDMAEAEGLPLSSFIQDEVNAPKEDSNG
jgi:hypothetical protein